VQKSSEESLDSLVTEQSFEGSGESCNSQQGNSEEERMLFMTCWNRLLCRRRIE